MTQQSELDRMVAAVKAGEASYEALVFAYMNAMLEIPTASDPTSGGGMRPVLLDVEGQPHMVVATSAEALDRTAEYADYSVSLYGSDIIEGLAAGHGLVVNTENDAFSMPPEMIEQLRPLAAQSNVRGGEAGEAGEPNERGEESEG